jgi:hypothetical protein
MLGACHQVRVSPARIVFSACDGEDFELTWGWSDGFLVVFMLGGFEMNLDCWPRQPAAWQRAAFREA